MGRRAGKWGNGAMKFRIADWGIRIIHRGDAESAESEIGERFYHEEHEVKSFFKTIF
jgi:hypothetical protein